MFLKWMETLAIYIKRLKKLTLHLRFKKLKTTTYPLKVDIFVDDLINKLNSVLLTVFLSLINIYINETVRVHARFPHRSLPRGAMG